VVGWRGGKGERRGEEGLGVVEDGDE